jgi:hypothetical protein
MEPAHRGSLGAPALKIESRRVELSIPFVPVLLHTRSHAVSRPSPAPSVQSVMIRSDASAVFALSTGHPMLNELCTS